MWRTGKKKKLIIICLVLISFVLLAECTGSKINEPENVLNSLSPSQTEVISDANISDTTTPIFTSTLQTTTPSLKIDSKYVTNFGFFTVTQVPVNISTTTIHDSEYLYKNILVKIDLIDSDAMAYLNLDDLNDNSGSNSDIHVERTIGNPEINYSLGPSNNAYFYYLGTSSGDYDLCKRSFINLNLDRLHYIMQNELFIDGGEYCILTNEGRIGIVNYILGSKKAVGSEHEEVLSLNVTVYNEVVK